MTQQYWSQKPSSFAETVELIEKQIRDEIIRETQEKQLYYHNIDHALSVKRRATTIFQAIKPVLTQKHSATELSRLQGSIGLCGLAHDMVQIFEPTLPHQPRKRKSGLSEELSANKLLKHIQEFNQTAIAQQIDPTILIGDREQQIIRDGIMATICIRDPQIGTKQIFSPYSIYQPYLYDSQAKISIVGTIVALADLGALGMEGVDAYIQDGILIFLEDNPYFYDLVANCRLANYPEPEVVREQLWTMANFIVNLAKERQARFELEIAGFTAQIRQILRDRVFTHLNSQSIEQIQNIIPIQADASLSELVDFFCAADNCQIKSNTSLN